MYVCVSDCQFVSLSVGLLSKLSVSLSVRLCLFACLYARLSIICLSVFLCLSVYLYVCMCLCICVSVCVRLFACLCFKNLHDIVLLSTSITMSMSGCKYFLKLNSITNK